MFRCTVLAETQRYTASDRRGVLWLAHLLLVAVCLIGCESSACWEALIELYVFETQADKPAVGQGRALLSVHLNFIASIVCVIAERAVCAYLGWQPQL